MTRLARARNALLIGVLAALASAALATAGAWDRLEGITSDWRARRLAEPAPAGLGIKLVLVDGPSIERIAAEQRVRWPWPREYFAALLGYLAEDGARAVVFDLDFLEPSSHGVEDDHTLGSAMAATPGFALALRLEGTVTAWPGPTPIEVDGLAHAAVRPGATFSAPDVIGGLSLRFGHVVQEADPDGVVRRVRAVYAFANRGVPQLAVAGYAAGTDVDRIELGARELRLGGKVLPLTSDGDLLLRYRAPNETGHFYEAYSAAGILADISNEQPPHGRYRDAYVLVGVSAENLFDNWPTPLGPTTAGVEVHATVLDNLLNERFLRPAPVWLVAGAAAALAVIGALLLLLRSSLRWNLAWAIVLLPIPACAALVAQSRGVAAPAVWPTMAVAFAVFGASSLNYAREGRRRLYLRRAFEQYLSPKVIARIVDDPGRLELGGERREVSVLFSDIEGFTGISETLDPHELGALLNDVLGDLTEIVLDEDGTLDKYQGDSILAFWNAPSDQPDHALLAVRAGLRFRQRLREREAEFAARAGRPLRLRIGVHTGLATVGNFGSRRRFSYTALGDTVNLASRLEGANKHLRTSFLVSEATWSQVARATHGRAVATIRVVGRADPVRVFEPLAPADAPAPAELEPFLRARAACEAAAWDEADRLLAALGDDGLAALYRERVVSLRATGATAWDDHWNLTQK